MATLSSGAEENLSESQHNVSVKQGAEDPAVPVCDTLLPQDVFCDFCMDSPGKALKSCLTCQVSYCEDHLRPHLEKATFQNHRLVEPLQDINSQTCETELLKKQEAIRQNVSAVDKGMEKLQTNNETIKRSLQEVGVIIKQQFTRLQTTVAEARKEMKEVLEAEQRQALRRVEGIQAHLEQKRAELMKTLAQMNKLSKSRSDVDFLQDYAEWKKGEADMCVPTVKISKMDHLNTFIKAVTDVTQELCGLIISSYKEKTHTMCKNDPKLSMRKVQPSSLPDPETHEDFLKHLRSLSFDPDTTHHFLRMMEDNRKLANTSPWQHSYPDHPGRFEYWRQPMTSESLYLGRRYIEAKVSGEGAHVGVTYKSIDRKGEESSSCITGNDFSWCVGRNSRGFSAWHAGVETVLEVTDITRIGLYLDFHRGAVSFYNVTGPMTLLHTYMAELIEPLYVTVWLSKKENIVSLANAK